MNQSSPLSIPSAIIIAAAIIAIAIIYVKKPAPAPIVSENKPAAEITLAPINPAQDHILGNPTAPIKLVEYSDPSCPFCKMFHSTMKTLMDTYGPQGTVAWVYRAFPLDKPDAQGRALHPNAGTESQAFECAAELGSNIAFWKYANRFYEITPSDQGKSLDRAELPKIATYVGLDEIAFDSCLSSGKYADKIEAQYISGINAGVRGTPATFVVLDTPAPASLDAIIGSESIKLGTPILMSSDRTKIMLSGALPEETFRAIIDGVTAK